jgi:predicted MFS family arabinose efflux permease
MKDGSSSRAYEWGLIAAGALALALSSGTMKTFGLFMAPLTKDAGLRITSVSFAFALGQMVSGISQPLFCAAADSKGPLRVLVSGALLIFTGFLLTAAFHSDWSVVLTIGVICSAGWGAAEYSVLIGAVSRNLRPSYQALAGGFINAGGSAGQFIFPPVLQKTISAYGWVTAMLAAGAASLFIIPLALVCKGPNGKDGKGSRNAPKTGGVKFSDLCAQVKAALRNPSYLLLHTSFFTCGFHVAFLSAHLANDIATHGHAGGTSAAAMSISGVFSIAGSLFSGAMGLKFKMKHILAVVYASRALTVGLFLLSPQTPFVYYAFSAALGFTWLATVAPTSELVRKFFGAEYLSTLFGLMMFTHQAGAFLGAWAGGIIFSQTGSYGAIWALDIALAVFAALVCLPIKEAR